MKQIMMFLFISTFSYSSFALEEIVCIYDRKNEVRGSFLLNPESSQAHLDVEKISATSERELLDGAGVVEKSGFDAVGWLQTYLKDDSIEKGYFLLAERRKESSRLVSIVFGEILNGQIHNQISVSWYLGFGETSQALGYLTCKVNNKADTSQSKK